MAGLILLNWISYLPSFALHGTAGTEGFGGLWAAYQLLIAPVVALAVIAFVIRDRHLAWATALADLPTLLGVLDSGGLRRGRGGLRLIGSTASSY